MLADRNLNRFNGAVRECLEQCYRAPNWLACLANYSERLRADGWSRGEVEKVQSVVRRILGAVVQVEISPFLVAESATHDADMASTSR